MTYSIHSSDWADYERSRLIEHADRRNATAREIRQIETADDILRRSVWAAEEAHARRSIRVLSRVFAAACFAVLAVYGWTITQKAIAIHAADVARVEKMREAK